MNPKKLPLTLESDTMNAFKSDFNQMLRKLLTSMESYEAEEGVLNAKINVSLKQDKARDYQANGYDGTRDITKPTFQHKIGISFQFKDEKSGTLGGDYEMVWDKDLNAYVMVEINNGQTSMFDEEAKERVVTAENADAEKPADEAADANAAYEAGKAFAQGIIDGAAEAKQIDGSAIGAPALPEACHDDEDYHQHAIDGVFRESEADEEKRDRQEHFDHIAKFVGQDMKIFVNGDMSSVRSAKGGNIILTSAGTAKDVFRADHEKLVQHEGHEVVCTGDYIGEGDSRRLLRVTIKCIECDETIWSMDNPEEDFGYAYEQPEE